MFDKDTIEKIHELQENWVEQVANRYKGKEFSRSTSSGIPLKPIYTPADIEDIDYGEIGIPGSYPYTRGLYPLQYQFQPWMNQNLHGFGLVEHTRERMDLLVKEGMIGYFGIPYHNLCFDMPTHCGFDADAPEARGFIGHGGMSLCTMNDMEVLFEGLDLDNIGVNFVLSAPTMVILAMYILLAERRGVPKEALSGNTTNWLYNQGHGDQSYMPMESNMKLMAQFIKFTAKNMPRWNHTCMDYYNMEEAGATPVEALAYTLSIASAVTDECIKIGLSPDEFVRGFGYAIRQGNDFFEEVCKLRALRRMWAKMFKEKYGCKKSGSLQIRVHGHSGGGVTLTKQQPLNNLVRAAFQCLAGIFGGVQGMTVSAYDEAIGLPTEESALLALRTQQVILHETGVANVSDPLAGSYYVEWLTSKIEEEANKVLEKIDRQGGFAACADKGWIKARIDEGAYRWQEDVRNGDQVVVGLNKFQMEDEPEPPEPFRLDPEVEKTAVERARAYKKERDNQKTEQALNRLREEAEKTKHKDGDMMPLIIDALRVEATLGETWGTIRQVFGDN